MAFFAPLIGALLSLTPLASAVLSTLAGAALSFASQRLRAKRQTSAPQGTRVGLTVDTNQPRQFVGGQTANGGGLVFWHLSGASNEKLWMVIALADHECNALVSVIVSGKNKAWNSGTGEVADYSSKLKVRFYSGAAGQAADSALVSASGGRWTSNHVGTGVCYVVVEATYDEALFPSGIPELGFVIQGAKLLDPRTSTTAYTTNSAIVAYNLLRGITVAGQPLIGMFVPSSAIRLSEAQAAANICAETVALKAGGSEARYRCGTILNVDQQNQDHIEEIIASMAGEVIETGGIYRIMAGAAQTPVASLTDDDFIMGDPLPYRPRKGRLQLVNAVTGSYFDPARNYAPVALPIRVSSLDEAEDGNRRFALNLDLTAVTSRTQAQRVMEIERRRARSMGAISGKARGARFVLEPGDWVTYTSTRRGFADKVFEVDANNGGMDLISDIVLREMDDEFDDWSTSLEIDDDQVIDLPPAGPTFSTITGAALTHILVTGTSGEQTPGVRATWAAVTDPTVTRIAMEYRKVGDTIALSATILDPTATSHSVTAGIQGGVQYEVRLRPLTQPQRSTNWSAWTPAASVADPQIVSISLESDIAHDIDDGIVDKDKLALQERIELALASARADAEASVAGNLEGIRDDFARVAMAITALQAETVDSKAFIRRQEIIRQTDTEAFAEAMTVVGTRLNGNEANVATLQGSVNGILAYYAVLLDVNGRLGFFKMDGTPAEISAIFGVDKFAITGTNINTPFVPFLVQNIAGAWRIVLDGEVHAPGSITANKLSVVTLDAISANFGTMTAGRVQNAANTTYLDLNTGDFQIG